MESSTQGTDDRPWTIVASHKPGQPASAVPTAEVHPGKKLRPKFPMRFEEIAPAEVRSGAKVLPNPKPPVKNQKGKDVYEIAVLVYINEGTIKCRLICQDCSDRNRYITYFDIPAKVMLDIDNTLEDLKMGTPSNFVPGSCLKIHEFFRVRSSMRIGIFCKKINHPTILIECRGDEYSGPCCSYLKAVDILGFRSQVARIRKAISATPNFNIVADYNRAMEFFSRQMEVEEKATCVKTLPPPPPPTASYAPAASSASSAPVAPIASVVGVGLRIQTASSSTGLSQKQKKALVQANAGKNQFMALQEDDSEKNEEGCEKLEGSNEKPEEVPLSKTQRKNLARRMRKKMERD